MEHNEAQTTVAAIIEAAGFKVQCFGGHETKRDDWTCDAWTFVLQRPCAIVSSFAPRAGGETAERFEFPFYTGTGQRRAKNIDLMHIRTSWGVKIDAAGNISGHKTRAVYLNVKRDFERVAKPVAPHVADLAYSWVLDGEAINESFNDWCANFGSDPDSIKALNTYQECCKTGEQLRKMFTREQLQALRDALQDY